jgi:hypothetical protein
MDTQSPWCWTLFSLMLLCACALLLTATEHAWACAVLTGLCALAFVLLVSLCAPQFCC